MKKTAFLLVLFLFLAAAYADGKPWTDSYGYLCFPGNNGIKSYCINIGNFDLDKDYEGNNVVMIWEKFIFSKPKVFSLGVVDNAINQVAIKCNPIQKDALVQFYNYYKDAVVGGSSYSKYDWSFESEPPGSYQDILNQFVCNGGYLNAYALYNKIDLNS